MESLNHYSRLRCLGGFQNSGQILNVGNKGVRKTRRAHFRCYSVVKMCQIMPKCPRQYQNGPSSYQLSPRDYQMSATYYQKCPRERTQLWLRRFLPHTLALCDPFNTLPHSASVQLRNTVSHFEHFPSTLPNNLALLCDPFNTLPHSASVQIRNTV